MQFPKKQFKLKFTVDPIN